MRQHCRDHRELLEGWVKEGCKAPKLVRLLQRHTGVPVPERTMQRFVREDLEVDDGGTVRMVDFEPGQVLEMDFAELGKVEWDDESRTVHALILVAAYSRHTFVWPCLSMDQDTVIVGLEAAWAFFGGVFWVLVPDNLKAIVRKAHPTSPSLSDGFLQYAQSRDFLVDPARVRKPQDKPKVERAVSYVRDDFFRGERFLSLDHMRRQAERWCTEVAGQRTHGTTRRKPLEAFEEDEQPVLRPAPTEPYDVPRWVDVKVGRDHTVVVAEAIYSVPYQLRGKTLRAEVTRTTVKFYDQRMLVKVHERAPRGATQLDETDLPPGKAELARKDQASLQQRAEAAGAHVAEYVEQLLDDPHPWSKFRHVYRLLGLCRRYGGDRVDEACRRALEVEVVDVQKIDGMLTRGVLGRPPEPSPPEPQGKVVPLRFARDKREFRASTEEEPHVS